MKIVCMGDSLTNYSGYDGLTIDQYWTSLVAKTTGHETINKGIAGQRTDQMLARFNTDVIANNPQICVIFGGVNDLFQKRELSIIMQNLGSMVTKCKAQSITPILITTTPQFHAYWSVTDGPESGNYDLTTHDFEIETNGKLPALRQAIRDYCSYNNVRLIDLYGSKFLDATGTQDLSCYITDRIHSSAKGHQIIADSVSPVIKALNTVGQFTKKLKIPLLEGQDPFRYGDFNEAFEQIDNAALPAEHAVNGSHFALWKSNTAYKKQDVVRTAACPNWGFFMCITAGTSATSAPQGYGEGDVVTDGSVVWVLKKFGGGAKSGVSLWMNSISYEKGMLVLYNSLLYSCLADHQSGLNFDQKKWQLINVGYLPDWQPNRIYSAKMLVLFEGVIYRAKTDHVSGSTFDQNIGDWEMIVDISTKITDWQVNRVYKKNEVVIYQRLFYRAKADHTSGAADWELLNIGYTADWQVGLLYLPNMLVIKNRIIYRCKVIHTSIDFDNEYAKWESLCGLGTKIEDWTPGLYYEQDRVIWNDSTLYRCLAPHKSTVFSENAANWQRLDIDYLRDWQPNTAYKTNETICQDGFLYRAKVNHTSGVTFAPEQWDLILKGYLEVWQAGRNYIYAETTFFGGRLMRCKAGHVSANLVNELNKWEPVGALPCISWLAGTIYFVGDFVVEGRLLYVCTITHKAASSMDMSKFNQLSIGYGPSWQPQTNYIQYQMVVYKRQLFRAKAAHTSSSSFNAGVWEVLASSRSTLEEWQSGAEYSIGEAVIYNGALYSCTKGNIASADFLQDVKAGCWQLIGITRQDVIRLALIL